MSTHAYLNVLCVIMYECGAHVGVFLLCLYFCVLVRVHALGRACVYLHVSLSVCVRSCVRARVRATVRPCVFVAVRVGVLGNHSF